MAEALNVVVGLGVTGLSCVRYLKKKGLPVAVTDTRANPPLLDVLHKEFPDVKVSLGALDKNYLQKASRIILSPGIALSQPEIAEQQARGIPVIGDIELFAEIVQAPVIAITGTNAKSTVTTLVGLMVEAAGYRVQAGGNLGIPALDLLQPDIEVYVLELSSFQLETTYSLAPRVATILNITPDHMDRYHDLADYQRAKYRVYQHCQTAVSNRDDALTTCHDTAVKKWYFTEHKPGPQEFGRVTVDGKLWLAQENDLLITVDELPVKGKHYQANALAALAIGHGFGLPREAMLQVLRDFKGLEHRCQFVRERDGVRWYNDSKGTNVGATQAAIEGLGSEMSGKLIMIMGGVGKNADFHPMVPVLEKYARHLILIGEAANDIAQAVGPRVPVVFADTMSDAVQRASAMAQANDSVLLSPACASFDMFRNYEHRGEVFRDIVEKL